MRRLEPNAIEALRKAADDFDQADALCRDAGLHLDGPLLHGRKVSVRDINAFLPKLIEYLEDLAQYDAKQSRDDSDARLTFAKSGTAIEYFLDDMLIARFKVHTHHCQEHVAPVIRRLRAYPTIDIGYEAALDIWNHRKERIKEEASRAR
ncbi:MAG: hypothetical protein NVS1B6_18000 [Steroidobacteraceae bacterium]